MKVTDYRVAIVVWTQEGCPACEDYVPRFQKVADAYASCIPSFVVDVGAQGRASDLYRIRETPTTTILRYGRQSLYRLVGAGSAQDIRNLFEYATRGLACEIA